MPAMLNVLNLSLLSLKIRFAVPLKRWDNCNILHVWRFVAPDSFTEGECSQLLLFTEAQRTGERPTKGGRGVNSFIFWMFSFPQFRRSTGPAPLKLASVVGYLEIQSHLQSLLN